MRSRLAVFLSVFATFLGVATNPAAATDKDVKWSGFYVGADVGLGNGQTDDRPTNFSAFGNQFPIPPPIAGLVTAQYDVSGAVYGGHVGYNFQFDKTVIGVEGSFSGSNISGDGTQVVLFTSARDLNWLATITPRVGYSVGQALLYAKGGVAWGEIESSVRLGGATILRGDDTPTGWVVGAGIEYALSNSIIIRADYSHVDLGTSGSMTNTGVLNIIPPGCCTITHDQDFTLDTLSIGASYKF